jgi:hypothetical protein
VRLVSVLVRVPVRDLARDLAPLCEGPYCFAAEIAFKSPRPSPFSNHRSVPKAVTRVQVRDTFDAILAVTDKNTVRSLTPDRVQVQSCSIPWAMQMKAVSTEEPARLVQCLTGAIHGCGGWVLSRGSNDTGMISMLFEFERQACVDIYSILIAAGLELSPNGHLRFTELCQCTRSQQRDCGAEIASVDLEVQTYPPEIVGTAPYTGVV